MAVFSSLIKDSIRVLLMLAVMALVACAADTTELALLDSVFSNESWLIQTQREDGSTFSQSDIGGYRVYFGRVSGFYTDEIDISDVQVPFRINLTAAKLVLAPGDYFVVVTVYDRQGRESTFSPEVKVTI